MNLKEMESAALEARKAAIATECESSDADLDALLEEVRAINEELETRKAEEAQRAELRDMVADANVGETIEIIETIEERKEMENIEIRNSKEYVDAFANYVKNGDDAECRALLTENVSGNVPVPELVYDIVKTAWEEEGIMRLVRKSYLRGNLKVGFEISASGAVIHTEGTNAPSEETLLLGVVNLVPASIKKWITVSDEALDMRGEAFLRYIYDELAHQIAKKAADELIAAIEACGTVSTTTCPGVPVLAAASIAAGTVAQAIALLSDRAANPAIIMNKQSYGAFKAVQYAASYPVDVFEGCPVLFNNSIDSFANATTGDTYAIVGDLGEGALANFPNGEEINIKFDDLSLAEKDLVKIVGRQYVGLGVVAPDAFVKIQK